MCSPVFALNSGRKIKSQSERRDDSRFMMSPPIAADDASPLRSEMMLRHFVPQ